MNPFSKIVVLTALLSAASVVLADSEKDCLLQGTVVHGEQTGQGMTTVKINSISKYDEDARCNMRRGQKMEFKLPEDARLKDAPSGSGGTGNHGGQVSRSNRYPQRIRQRNATNQF